MSFLATEDYGDEKRLALDLSNADPTCSLLKRYRSQRVSFLATEDYGDKKQLALDLSNTDPTYSL